MPMLKRLLCFLFLLITLSGFSARETVLFDIMLFGNKVGYLTITREPQPDGTELYVLDTKSKAKILWITRENSAHYEVVYKDGKLVSSGFKEIENGEVKRWNNITWDGKTYTSNGYKGKKTFTEVPTYSIVSVYFRDMKNINRIFYEIEGDFNDLRNPEPGTYEFKSSDGNRNVYHYVNGKIHHMEFHVSFATVKMVRIN